MQIPPKQPLHFSRFAVGLALISALACKNDVQVPVREKVDLSRHVTADLAEAVTPDGKFILAGAEYSPYPQLTASEAEEMALAAAKLFGPHTRPLLEKEHGGRISFDELVPGSVYYAATPYEPVPAAFHPAIRKQMGPYYLVTLERQGVPVINVAVSAYNTDITFVDGRLTRAPRVHGADFIMSGVPFTAHLSSPEAAAALVHARTGSKLAAVPKLVLPPVPFAPQHAKWKIEIDQPSSIGNHGPVREIYVSYFFGGLYVAADQQPSSRLTQDIPVPITTSQYSESAPSTVIRTRPDIPTEFVTIK